MPIMCPLLLRCELRSTHPTAIVVCVEERRDKGVYVLRIVNERPRFWLPKEQYRERETKW